MEGASDLLADFEHLRRGVALVNLWRGKGWELHSVDQREAKAREEILEIPAVKRGALDFNGPLHDRVA